MCYTSGMKTLNRSVSRRAFVTGGLFAAAAFPFIGHGRNAVGKATLALIGAGKQGRNLLHAFLGQPNLVVTAVCDCDRVRREDRARVVNDYYAANPQLGVPGTACRAVADFRAVLADPSIDMVCIATPDHWHAYIAVEAMKAGKDVYCEKPLTFSIDEARKVIAAQEKYGRVFQTGSMQRSWPVFRTACMIVRNGLIGDIKYVDANYGHGGSKLGGPSHPIRFFDDPKNAATEGAPNPNVDWDMWLGPAKWRAYSDQLAPRGVNKFYPMFWRFDDDLGSGYNGDWGAHHLDILQWALGKDRSGPVAIENFSCDFQPPNALVAPDVFSTPYHFSFDVVYDNGFRARVCDTSKAKQGLTFHAAKGDLFVTRGKLERPKHLRKWNEKRDLKDGDVRLYRNAKAHSHEMDFVDGIFDGTPTATDCEIGQAPLLRRTRLPQRRPDGRSPAVHDPSTGAPHGRPARLAADARPPPAP